MEPTFDTWTSIFLLAVAMGLFLFFVLITGKVKKNYPIALFVLAFSIILFQYVLYWTNYQNQYPYLIYIPHVCYYLTGPLLYLYLLNVYQVKVRSDYMLHFIPAFLTLLPNLIHWLNSTGILQANLPFQFLLTGHWFVVAHMVIYTIMIVRLILNNNSQGSEFQKVRHNWSLILISLYALFILAYISYYVLVKFSFFNSKWDYMISFIMSITIYTIGFFIVKRPSIFDGELFASVFLPIKNKEDSFEASLLNEFYENLTVYMKNEKPFIDNELRLVNLADQVGFSTHLLSRVINKKSGKNFNSFINDYRLNEAESLLLKNDDQYIKNIYFDVGFNNKATFYKAFKNKYNCTPSEYKKRLVNV